MLERQRDLDCVQIVDFGFVITVFCFWCGEFFFLMLVKFMNGEYAQDHLCRLLLECCIPWKKCLLEQFVKNCSPETELKLGKIVEDSPVGGTPC